jgi:hypothetical protein
MLKMLRKNFKLVAKCVFLDLTQIIKIFDIDAIHVSECVSVWFVVWLLFL